MNVLFVNTRYINGGAEKVARQLYLGLSRNDDINTFFMEGRKTVTNLYIYDCTTTTRIVNAVKSIISNNARVHDQYALKKILKVIRRFNIDIVHFHNIHGNYIGIKDLIEIQKYCKIVWTLHDMWLFTGHCAYPVNCDNWKINDCKTCSKFELYPKIRVDVASRIYACKKNVVLQADNITFVMPCKWLSDMAEYIFLKGKTKYVIHNGVDTNLYTIKDKVLLRNKYHIKQDKFILLFGVSNLNNYFKGGKVLIDALERIELKDKYFVILLGKGEKLPLPKEFEIYHMGYIDDENVMSEIYSLADVFILPSVAENFPCSILESMASGTPVIASDVGGISEQINDDTGWLFEKGNSKQLSEIIQKVYANRDELKAMGIKCRKRVEDFFSEEKMLIEYMQLYNQLLNKSYHAR